MTRFILFLFLILNSLSLKSQLYKPLDTADYAQRKVFIKTYTAENELYIKDLKNRYPGKTGQELAKIYKEFETDFVAQVKNKDFIFNSALDADVAALIIKLRKNNPNIPQKLKVLIAKDNAPNAYCLADGTFVINLGLFNLLENDDQLASVIAHELGHKMGEHVLRDIVGFINQDKMDKITVQNIKSDRLNRNKKAFDVLKTRLYRKGIEKRKNEMRADSLGFVLYRKTDFSKTDFVNALQNLKKYDTISPVPVKLETYKKYFSLPSQEFKDKWMKKEDFSAYDYKAFKAKINEDSVASHPEIPERVAKLQKYFTELKTTAPPAPSSESFKKAEHIARMEILPNFFHAEEYGLGIYTSLQFLQENEETKYYENWLGKCFAKIYEGRKNYTLNRYLDRIDPKDQSESYQQFLNFMWNLSLNEIKTIADYYQNKKS
jgi:Zn-dependent protease with chaperone function